jgi:hypothetical protein
LKRFKPFEFERFTRRAKISVGFRGRTHGSDAGNFSHHRQLAEERIDITNMSAFEILSAILDTLTGDKEKMDFFSSSVIGLIASCC